MGGIDLPALHVTFWVVFIFKSHGRFLVRMGTRVYIVEVEAFVSLITMI